MIETESGVRLGGLKLSRFQENVDELAFVEQALSQTKLCEPSSSRSFKLESDNSATGACAELCMEQVRGITPGYICQNPASSLTKQLKLHCSNSPLTYAAYCPVLSLAIKYVELVLQGRGVCRTNMH